MIKKIFTQFPDDEQNFYEDEKYNVLYETDLTPIEYSRCAFLISKDKSMHIGDEDILKYAKCILNTYKDLDQYKREKDQIINTLSRFDLYNYDVYRKSALQYQTIINLIDKRKNELNFYKSKFFLFDNIDFVCYTPSDNKDIKCYILVISPVEKDSLLPNLSYLLYNYVDGIYQTTIDSLMRDMAEQIKGEEDE